MSELTIKDLWLDANQGIGRDNQAFGYIGTDEEYEDEDSDNQEYCGWFFDWPGTTPRIQSETERLAVINSLTTDETMQCNESIPLELAIEKLTTYLANRFPEFE